jgi:hypothetical protein
MANDTNGTPWILDTAGAVTTARVNAKTVRWVAPAASAGQKVILKNAAGRVVWEDYATGSNYVVSDRVETIWNGLTVDTIDSGKLYIEVDR